MSDNKQELKEIRDHLLACSNLLQQTAQSGDIAQVHSWIVIYQQDIEQGYRVLLRYAEQIFEDAVMLKMPQLPTRSYSLKDYAVDVEMWNACHKFILQNLAPDVLTPTQVSLERLEEENPEAAVKHLSAAMGQMLMELLAVIHFMLTGMEDHLRVYYEVKKMLEKTYTDVEAEVKGYRLYIKRNNNTEVFGYQGRLQEYKPFFSCYKTIEFNAETVFKVCQLLIKQWELQDKLDELLEATAIFSVDCCNYILH